MTDKFHRDDESIAVKIGPNAVFSIMGMWRGIAEMGIGQSLFSVTREISGQTKKVSVSYIY
jgi:hypothetical protein